MNYKASSVGTEISCTMYDINTEILDNNNRLEQILLEALAKDNFRILDKVSHRFQPQGYTFVVLLAESHAAIHTFPEFNSLFFYLYSCRGENDGRKTFEYLKENLNPSSVDFNTRPIIVKNNIIV
mgnify:CR=1 FL=1